MFGLLYPAGLPTIPTDMVASSSPLEGRSGSSNNSSGSGAASKAGLSSKSAASRRVEAAAAARATSPAPAGAAAELAFAGAHILEIYDLSNAVRTAQLEQFLARLQPQAELPPLLR